MRMKPNLCEISKRLRNMTHMALVMTFCLQAASHAVAEEAEDQSHLANKQFLALQVENDLFGNLESTDRHYTSGLQFSYLSEASKEPGLARDIATALVPFAPENATPKLHRYGLAIGHSIFTPANVLATRLQSNDRPYAAWAHLTFTVQTEWRSSEFSSFQDKWKFDAGLVGPAAGGDLIQNTVHEIVDSEVISGWSNQLPNEIGLNVSFERTWNSPDLDLGGFLDLQVDTIPYVTAALGNVQTSIGGGATVRIGPNLPNDFGPPRIYPGIGGSEAFELSPGELSWYLFAGAESRLVARDMFLDGTLFSDSHSVDKRILVNDLRLGAVATYECFRVSFTQVQRTKEFFGQPHPDKFGAITISIGF